MRNCKVCNEPIPEGRLKALPNATTCVNCSQTGRVIGVNVVSGNSSYSEIQIVSPEAANELKRLNSGRHPGKLHG